MDILTILIIEGIIIGISHMSINTRAEKRAKDERALLARLAQCTGRQD